MRAPEVLSTARLVLRRPTPADAPAILRRYSADPEVTRYLAWPRHLSVQDTAAFVDWSDQVWTRHPPGPYLVADPDGTLLGATGLDRETPWRAATGYVLARDAWGRGYATEVTTAMIGLADSLGVARLYALCHTAHHASAHVLDKAGFTREGILRRHSIFPNLDAEQPMDVACWARIR